MRNRSVRHAAIACVVGAIGLFTVACAPPPAPTAETWQWKSTRVTVNNSQDEVCVIVCVNRNDEPKTVTVAFRVKVGVPNSAQAWVANGSAYNDLGAGESRNLVGGEQNPVNFTNVVPLDVLDLLTGAAPLEVIGVYTWAVEEDEVGLGSPANTTANLFRDALNATVAAGNIPADLNFLLDSILDNIGGALLLLGSNILDIDFGLGDINDDAMGGGLYIGLAVKGGLADIVNAAVPGVTFDFDIPIATVPPDIQRGGIFTTGVSPKTFLGQTFTGQDGQHTYDFQVAKV